MDLNFGALLLFCLTIIALVAISHGETYLALKAVEAIKGLARDILRGGKKRGKSEKNERENGRFD